MNNQGIKQDIRILNIDEIMDFLVKNGEKAFRAKQVYEWLWRKNAHSFELMSNLPIKIRQLLDNNFRIQHLRVEQVVRSEDGTIKTTFRIEEGGLVEGVLIPAESRATACISCQQGCKLGCSFCATGSMGFTRNLTAGEIYDQVWVIKQQAEQELGISFSNIVYMGMGEPLLNYENVMTSIRKITSKEGLEMSPRRITLSTAGLPHMIKRLADDEVRFNLALSLHSAVEETRTRIMPVNKVYPLDKLIEAIKYFHNKTGSRVTFEYLLLNEINDTLNDARSLAEFCKNFPCKINIIEYNTTGDGLFKPSEAESTDKFVKFLESRNIIVNIRRSRGKDIDAACGQLANRGKTKDNSNKS